jgi:hypothetical protein
MLSFIAVVRGLWLMFASGASYSDSFSTVMRSAWIAELEAEKQGLGLGHGCQDPLPKHLAGATIRLPMNPQRWADEDEGATSVACDHVSDIPDSERLSGNSATSQLLARESIQGSEDRAMGAYDAVSELSDPGKPPSASTDPGPEA